MTSQPKASKGSVGVESFQGRLRLRLPRQLYGGKQKYLTLGIDDTLENQKEAEAKAWQIEKDILAGYFDPTLAKYRQALALVEPVKKPQKALALPELWEKYTEHKANILQSTTILTTYKRIKNHIASFPTKELEDAIAIRDYLLATKSQNTAKRVLTHLSACCDWAYEAKLIADNPFTKMAGKVKVVSSSQREEIDPFTAQERDAIIAAFDSHRHYSYYANFVRFLFMTGCRTGEAVALKWKHISKDCRQITFCESVNTQFKIRKDTKTHKIRKLPCNASLQALLISIKPDNCEPESLVFPSPTGKEIDAGAFLNRAWKGYKNHRGNQIVGIVTQLVQEGKVERYRCLYNTRHTFCSMAMEAGISPTQIAKWVGNSVEVLINHYAGTTGQVQIPEF